jgi:hypothetical protein
MTSHRPESSKSLYGTHPIHESLDALDPLLTIFVTLVTRFFHTTSAVFLCRKTSRRIETK